MSFDVSIPVRFGDVDPARMIYYPRFYHLLHVAFEELFDRHIGIPYDKLLEEHSLAFPTVHVETDFVSPIRFGELMRIGCEVPRIGTSSVVFDYRVNVGAESAPRARATLTRVAMDTNRGQAVPLPDFIRNPLAELQPRD
jgi:4-hydroxybenzoyl-CoA thioesterase